MVDVSDSVTTLREAFFARVEMDTTWMKMDASVTVKLTAMINNGSISVKIQQYPTIVMEW